MSRNLRLFIEQVIRQELEEVAISTSQAESSGFALLVEQRGKLKNIVLFNPAVFKEEYKKLKVDKKKTTGFQSIVGMIYLEADKGCKTWRVSGVAALKGHGPLLYDIALSECGAEGLAPDKENVTSSARAVWRYNFTNRRNEFLITKLGPSCSFVGNQRAMNKEEYLDCKYVLKKPVSSDALKTKATSVFSELKTAYGGKPEQTLVELAGMYFVHRT